ncbi:APC family permease [Sphingomonas bacterium]|uniref:APC family permease n=1 Tax=Sphingomonas bacterium TaxID=1895847 RepID=UPI0015775668|nr:APC family permease [Sphingomonas bacterium]
MTAAAMPRPLPRCLGTIGMLFLTLSAISPASSLFIIVPGMLLGAGTGALWAFAIAGLVCLATAYVYAELSSAFPIAGGEYVMVARTLGPLPGFVMLVVNVFNNMLFPPVVGLGVSAVLADVIPGLPQVPTAIFVVAGSTLCGLLNIRINALVTGAFLLIELLALGLVMLLGLLHPARALVPLLAHPAMPAGQVLVPASTPAIGLATTVAIFALNGYGMAVYFGEEMHEAPARIARVVLISFVGALLFELLPTLAALIGAPNLGALLRAEDPFGGFVATLGGRLLAGTVAIGVAVAILNAAIVIVLGSARFLYSTGRDRVWGGRADRWIAMLHPRWHSPWVATLANGAVGMGACLISLKFLLILSGGGLIVTYAAISLAAIVGRRTGGTAHGRYRMPLYPLAPLFALAALAYVIWTNWLDIEEGRPGLIATGAQIIGAVLYYRLVLRRRGAWIVHDPGAPSEQGSPLRSAAARL